MLSVAGLHAWYGASHVLQGVESEVAEGEIVCLVGRNGAGKTTTLKAVMGLLRRAAGRVRFEGLDLLALPAHARYRLDLAFVPKERRIVPGLTVREGTTIRLVEQNVGLALAIIDRAYVLDGGAVVHADSARTMLAGEAIVERHCLVSGRRWPPGSLVIAPPPWPRSGPRWPPPGRRRRSGRSPAGRWGR